MRLGKTQKENTAKTSILSKNIGVFSVLKHSQSDFKSFITFFGCVFCCRAEINCLRSNAYAWDFLQFKEFELYWGAVFFFF